MHCMLLRRSLAPHTSLVARRHPRHQRATTLVRPAAPPTHQHASSSQHTDAASNASSAAARSAYLHLPFCKRKCFYCDFPVQAVGSYAQSPTTLDRMQRYVDTVCQEIHLTAVPQSAPLSTVYFGGGTPSLCPVPLIQQLLDALANTFGISPDAEISLEADPGTFDRAQLRAYRQLGVNRISLGVQCFDQELLEACGRSHSLEEVYTAIDDVQASGFDSWSLDLISGLPRLTVDKWQHSLNECVRAGPHHVSVYDLQVEEGTPFARWYPPGSQALPGDDEAATMYTVASRTLRAAGYEHYEISSYAKAGHRSRHNQVYWQLEPYLAFGLGAASYMGGRRFSRPRRMADYTAWVACLATAPPGPCATSTSVPSSGAGDRSPAAPSQGTPHSVLSPSQEPLHAGAGDRSPGVPSQDTPQSVPLPSQEPLHSAVASEEAPSGPPHGSSSQGGPTHSSAQASGAAGSRSDDRGGDPGQAAEHAGGPSGGGGGAGGAVQQQQLLPPQSDEDLMLDAVMLRLRTSDGLDMAGFRSRFGSGAAEVVLGALGKHARLGLVVGYGAGGRVVAPGGLGGAARVRLKDPEGFLVSNNVIADVFAALGDVGASSAAS